MAENSNLNIQINSTSDTRGVKDVRQELKAVQQEMSELRAAGQVGSQAFDNLKSKAFGLTTELKTIQRENKGLNGSLMQSTAGLLNLSKNLTVVSLGLRETVKGFQDLGKDGSKSTFDMAINISVLATQVLALVPAIQAVSLALKTMIATNPYLLIGAVIIGTLIVAYKQLSDIIEGVNKKFSLLQGTIAQAALLYKYFAGQIATSDFINLKLAKEGFEQISKALEDIFGWTQILNNIVAGENIFDVLWNSMVRLVDGIKSMPAGILKFLGIEIGDTGTSHAGEDYKGQAKEEDAQGVSRTKNNNKSSNKSSNKTTEKETLTFAQEYDKTLKETNDKLTQINTDLKDINLTEGKKNHLLKERIKLQQQLDDLENNKRNTGKFGTSDESDKGAIAQTLAIIANARFRGAVKLKPLNPRQRESDENERVDELMNSMSENFQGMVGATQSMLQNLGLMETGFGQILGGVAQVIEIFKSAFSAGSQIFGFIGDLISLFPGGGLVGSVVGGISGGGFAFGGYTGSGGKFQTAGVVHKGEYVFPQNAVSKWGIQVLDWMSGVKSNNTSDTNYFNGGAVNGMMNPNITVIVESEVEKTKSTKFYHNTLPEYQARQNKKRIS